MRNWMAVFVAGIFILLANCSSIRVNMDYDQEADFSAYKTFAWLPQRKGTAARNPLADKRIKKAVNDELIAKGYAGDTRVPDLLLAYHTGMRSKIDVTSWGYRYGRYWRYPVGRVSVYQYQEGTLVLDIVDAQKKELVWRGVAQKALSETSSVEKKEENLTKIVAKLLKKFPPQK